MNETTPGALLVLDTGLFPDAATVEEALLLDPDRSAIHRQKISPREMDNDAWDKLLGNILAARTIVTL